MNQVNVMFYRLSTGLARDKCLMKVPWSHHCHQSSDSAVSWLASLENGHFLGHTQALLAFLNSCLTPFFFQAFSFWNVGKDFEREKREGENFHSINSSERRCVFIWEMHFLICWFKISKYYLESFGRIANLLLRQLFDHMSKNGASSIEKIANILFPHNSHRESLWFLLFHLFSFSVTIALLKNPKTPDFSPWGHLNISTKSKQCSQSRTLYHVGLDRQKYGDISMVCSVLTNQVRWLWKQMLYLMKKKKTQQLPEEGWGFQWRPLSSQL